MLVVDKPAGPTSHDVVDGVRRALGMRRVGHTGTLDPFASGVLPLCLGQATRLARFLTAGDKAYRARVRLGFATATDDLTGEPLGEPQPVSVSEAALAGACAALTGVIDQVPPAFSAKHVDGRRAYALARAGAEVPRTPCAVTVHELRVLAVEGAEVDLEVTCSAGTYVRALARDLGERLGVGGHLVGLRRLRSGSFSLERAVPFPALAGAAEQVIRLRELLTDLPAATVGEDGARALRQGRDLVPSLVLSGFPGDPPPPRLRVLDEGGELLALAVPTGFEAPADGPLPRRPALHGDVVLAEAG